MSMKLGVFKRKILDIPDVYNNFDVYTYNDINELHDEILDVELWEDEKEVNIILIG